MRGNLLILLFLSLVVLWGCSRTQTSQTPDSKQQTSAEKALASPTPSPGVSGLVLTPSTPQTAANASEVKAKIDACALLTSKEIESIQGEPLKEKKLSGRTEGGFMVSNCFFTLPTFTNSISLSVTQQGEGGGSLAPRQFWRDTFAGKERERKREKGRVEEEEEESAPRKKIAGTGEEAFWMGSRVGGALYVLKGNSYVRVSVGGPGDEASKIKKCKALVQKALARL